MIFRNPTSNDLQTIYSIENLCFPIDEAASLDAFTERLKFFSKHFWLLEIEGQIIGYINGMVSNQKTIKDEMFQKAELHDENGLWQSVFGLAVRHEYRKKGYAANLLDYMIAKAKEQHRAGITLTCKEYLLPYYKKFGFTDLGISLSIHGGATWHDMVLEF